MRRSSDGLSALVRNELGADPTNGHWYVFAALGIEAVPEQAVPTEEVRYRRRKKRRDGAVNEHGLRFDETVPVETIRVVDPAIEAIPEVERKFIGEKVTHRLAQAPGSYKVLRYVRAVVRRRDHRTGADAGGAGERAGACVSGREFPGRDAGGQVPLSRVSLLK